MIFGFNTDIAHAGTVYHVQSEARVADLLIQTQIFVQGRCIAKRATSYADQAARPGFSESDIHELLKQQHRLVLDAVREGRLEPLLANSTPGQDAGGGLALEWLSAPAICADGALRLCLLVTHDGKPVAGAHLSCRLMTSEQTAVAAEALSDIDGSAELAVTLDHVAAAELPILVEATHDGASASKKFRLKRTGD